MQLLQLPSPNYNNCLISYTQVILRRIFSKFPTIFRVPYCSGNATWKSCAHDIIQYYIPNNILLQNNS